MQKIVRLALNSAEWFISISIIMLYFNVNLLAIFH